MLPKTSTTPSILPDRYYTSFKANPTAFCCFETEDPEDNTIKSFAIVGTLNGTIEIVALEKGAIPEVKFEHKSESQINAIILIATKPKIYFVAQFRGMELIWFNLDFENGMIKNLIKLKSYSLTHFGFCQSIWDKNEKRMLVPGKDDDYEMLSILYENSGEKAISLGANFLFSSFKKRHPNTEFTVDDCFKGTISSFQQIHETIGYEECDRLLIGFEDATLIIYDIRTKEVINLFKAPSKYSQLIAFAVSKDSEFQRWRIAVTVCSRIFEVNYENQEFELTKRIKKTGFANVNCSHICFNTIGDILICGYSSGRIEFYNVPEYNIFKVMNFHESSILSMNVLTISKNDEILFIGDEEGKMSQMNMKKLKCSQNVQEN
uniref:Uncharacterized protein n=1 Tax=Panagrolaimus superbus TaxID=310955 RepID=A0A914Y2K5_9BILA